MVIDEACLGRRHFVSSVVSERTGEARRRGACLEALSQHLAAAKYVVLLQHGLSDEDIVFYEALRREPSRVTRILVQRQQPPCVGSPGSGGAEPVEEAPGAESAGNGGRCVPLLVKTQAQWVTSLTETVQEGRLVFVTCSSAVDARTVYTYLVRTLGSDPPAGGEDP